MGGESGERLQHSRPVLPRLPHADDAARTDLEAGLAHGPQSVQAVLIGPGGDDFLVELLRGVDVVVVVVEARPLQPLRLVGREHAERHAGLQAQGLHLPDDRGHRRQVPVLEIAPSRAHAEPGGAGGLGLAGGGPNRLPRHELGRLDPGIVVAALGTVLAVLRTTAGLDVEEGAQLHFVGVEVMPVDLVRAMEQVVQGQGKEIENLFSGPVRAHLTRRSGTAFCGGGIADVSLLHLCGV